MFPRRIETYLNQISSKYKAICILGPRQSGKSTLAKSLFADFKYLSLEDPDIRTLALEDPRTFFAQANTNTIIDEIQRAPDLLSYLQGILDDKKDRRRWILTGSDSLLLSNRISQSLAGRSRLVHLLPFSFNEIPEHLRPRSIEEALFSGCYPRIYDEGLSPSEWYSDYFQTYVEKDLRSNLNISNLVQFERFVKILAGRTGQLINYSSFENDVGISHVTASSWMSVLDASFITFRLAPHFKNFSKRVIKSPKTYFWDTGLLCNLLQIRNLSQLNSHPLRGQIFENWIIAEIFKFYFWQGQTAPLYFWRDQHGHEIDIVIDRSTYLYPIEIKLSRTFNSSFCKNINWFNKLQGRSNGAVIYGSDDVTRFKEIDVVSWQNIERYLKNLYETDWDEL